MPQAVQAELGDSARPSRAERRKETSDKRRVRKRGLRPRFVSIREACEYIGCSRSYFYEHVLNKVRTIALGKRRLVDFDSLEELGDELLAAG